MENAHFHKGIHDVRLKILMIERMPNAIAPYKKYPLTFFFDAFEPHQTGKNMNKQWMIFELSNRNLGFLSKVSAFKKR